MSGVFYGTIQKVEAFTDRLVIRCVRDFFHGDGLMNNDVWIWEIERPEQEKSAMLRSMIGRPIAYFQVTESKEGQSLLVSLDESSEAISVSGKCVRKKEESRDVRDLEDVVVQLSRRVQRDESDYLALSRKLTAIATFVEQKIDRAQRRAGFEQQRGSGKAEGFSREIEDLQTILRKLKEPDQLAEASG